MGDKDLGFRINVRKQLSSVDAILTLWVFLKKLNDAIHTAGRV